MNLLSEALNVATVSSRRVGDFVFDVVKNESHASKLNITKNPIETGATISDHAFLDPKEITITGVIVNYDPPADISAMIPGISGLDIPIPLPVDVAAITTQAIELAQQVLSAMDYAGEIKDRVIAPFLPNFNDSGIDASSTAGRVKKAYSDLLKIQKSGELTEVMTGIELYKDMALTGVSLMQKDDGSAEFSLSLREVFVVNTQTAEGLKATGRAKNQSAKVSNKGKTQPQTSAIQKTGEIVSDLFR